MAIFTNKRNFFLRDDLKHSKNQSGPKWPHLSIFSLIFLAIWCSGPPGCGYVSSKFVGGPEMCFYCKIRNFYIFTVHFFFKFIRKTWANRFRGVRVLWAHSRATKREKRPKNQLRFLEVFWLVKFLTNKSFKFICQKLGFQIVTLIFPY